MRIFKCIPRCAFWLLGTSLGFAGRGVLIKEFLPNMKNGSLKIFNFTQIQRNPVTHIYIYIYHTQYLNLFDELFIILLNSGIKKSFIICINLARGRVQVNNLILHVDCSLILYFFVFSLHISTFTFPRSHNQFVYDEDKELTLLGILKLSLDFITYFHCLASNEPNKPTPTNRKLFFVFELNKRGQLGTMNLSHRYRLN